MFNPSKENRRKLPEWKKVSHCRKNFAGPENMNPYGKYKQIMVYSVGR